MEKDPRNKCSRCSTQLVGPYPGAFEPVVCYTCRIKALDTPTVVKESLMDAADRIAETFPE